ncbi:hypothetical protein BB934_38820 (plasmid) [Microvirga ossetica]|uniref:Uncharacterized protein n=1 Tax=Microvirga ossetica TaxID=1882682 RepID=A0A1B2EW66_9HYPH|nr:hypothetical protein BB934_38820 [Microvirga ossetica]
MAATAIAISAGRALSFLETTASLTVEKTLAAMQEASSIAYRPPGENISEHVGTIRNFVWGHYDDLE